MPQKNIKDTKEKAETKKVKEEKKETKQVKDAVKEKIVANANGKPNGKAIQLKPQEAYRFFQEEQKKLTHINKDLVDIEQILMELDKTIFAVNELQNSKDKELFINLGNGVFIKAKLEDSSKLVVNYASKAMLPKNSKDVLDNLAKRKQKAKTNFKKLQELQTQTQNNVNALYKYLNALQQKQNTEKKA